MMGNKDQTRGTGGIIMHPVPFFTDNTNHLPISMMKKIQASLDKPFDESGIRIQFKPSSSAEFKKVLKDVNERIVRSVKQFPIKTKKRLEK